MITAIARVNNTKLTDNLTQILRDEANVPRAGIRVSDLIYCLKKSALSKKDGSYHEDDENTIHTWNNGKFWHEGVQSRLIKSDLSRYLVEHGIKYKDIEGHPDIIDTRDQEIYELKTIKNAYALTYPSTKIIPSTMSTKDSGAKPKDHHMQQLKAYMAISGIYDGRILYHPLSTVEGEKELYEFTVTIDEEEAKLILSNLLKRKKTMEENPETDVKRVTASWDENWQCLYCPYATQEICPDGFSIAERRRSNRKTVLEIPFRTKLKK